MQQAYRLESGQNIRCSVLSEQAWKATGEIIHVSQKSVSLRLPIAAAYGTAVRLDVDDALILGTVAGCTRAGADFLLNITMEQVIPSVSNLARLVATILQQSPDSVAPLRESRQVPAQLPVDLRFGNRAVGAVK